MTSANAKHGKLKSVALKTGVQGKPKGDKSVPDVLQILRERIACCELLPGTKLNEYELASEFVVPRTRIRDAFLALEQRGLIERTPNRGAMVARLDPVQVFHIYDMREVLEGLCARLATQNVPNESWQDLLDEFSGPVGEAVKEGDFETYTEIYGRFRRRCIAAADNPELTKALDSMYEKTQVLIRRIVILPGRGELGVREHRAVLEAMRKGDAEAAERLRRENMRSAKVFLTRYMKYIL
ncbi:MAG: GntR family transcriptional regulator [Candidimonas sp.]|nr:MAG: GntR family transcriptional regulator [Candidimonas sp.]TAM20280.1 MAG: GntR family transcriptional regulator [Candidimonas sp.]TAM79935.1 MAG: GntR family transcriptional regulator [Candidimonas sp.]